MQIKEICRCILLFNFLNDWSLTILWLSGDRAERARLEMRAENKGFVPVLTSLKMNEGPLHGNDSRQVCYDAYVLLPEAAGEDSLFASSYLVRRRATMRDAQWLPPSDYALQTTPQPGAPTTAANLSLEKRAMNLLAGEDVPAVLFDSLLHTSDGAPKPLLTKRSDVVILLNWTPYEGGPETACLRANLQGPSAWKCCSLTLDTESGKMCEARLARSLLLDWKTGNHQLMPKPQLVFEAELPQHEVEKFRGTGNFWFDHHENEWGFARDTCRGKTQMEQRPSLRNRVDCGVEEVRWITDVPRGAQGRGLIWASGGGCCCCGWRGWWWKPPWWLGAKAKGIFEEHHPHMHQWHWEPLTAHCPVGGWWESNYLPWGQWGHDSPDQQARVQGGGIRLVQTSKEHSAPGKWSGKELVPVRGSIWPGESSLVCYVWLFSRGCSSQLLFCIDTVDCGP